MVGRGRVHKASTAECQRYCEGMPHCASFAWWPDGGCHVQDFHSKEIAADSKVVSGPVRCPLVPTTTLEGKTTAASTTEKVATKAATQSTTESTTPTPTTGPIVGCKTS